MNSKQLESTKLSVKTDISACKGENYDGIVTGNPCKCGSGGTANLGDHCTANINLIIVKCISNDII